MEKIYIILFTIFPLQLLSQYVPESRAIDIANAKEECAERIFKIYADMRQNFNQSVENASKKDLNGFERENKILQKNSKLVSNLLQQYYVFCNQNDSITLPQLTLTSPEVKRIWSEKLPTNSTIELIYMTNEIYNFSLKLDTSMEKLEMIDILKKMALFFIECDKILERK